jgi:threonine/homoserine/homoserine lactone efflux protein
MTLLATGLVLGFIVSVPPGPNSALCVTLACGGVRRAIPLITGAALTDAAYSLLAASGILIASQAGAEVLAVLTPCFLFATAILFWSPGSRSSKATFGVALLNPATAAIWLSLSSIPALQALSVTDLLLRSLPVALGTAIWFTLLAIATAKLSVRLGPELTTRVQQLSAGLLALMGMLSLAALLQ